MVHIAVVVGFGDDGEIHMRVPVRPVDELTLLGTRSEQKCVDKLVEEGCWRDVQVTPLEFAAAHEVIGGTHEAWDGFFHQRLGALQTWNELLGAKMQMLACRSNAALKLHHCVIRTAGNSECLHGCKKWQWQQARLHCMPCWGSWWLL